MRAEVFNREEGPSVPRINSGLPRWIDAVIAFAALIVAAPFIVIIAPVIAATSRGPVFFRQGRVGQYGRLFNLYKLRTMITAGDGPQVTRRDDARITRVGRFLRRTKLDELPTFWNVLRGDMSLVGPRPEVPRYVKLDDPIWQTILTVRPGLTDPVTLRLRNEELLLSQIKTDTEKYYVDELQPAKLKGYVDYLEERDWRSDLSILGHTLAAIVDPADAPPDLGQGRHAPQKADFQTASKD
ncbi:MAG TPA: sugar transferase [Pyrinomonadaceae bacterium]|nr:sugar transferase [Pyrinomonadaceae bacterium]